MEAVTDSMEAEVERRLEALRNDPERLMRYDLNGDGRIDAKEWAEVRRVITAEVQTERQRQESSRVGAKTMPMAQEVLQDRFEVREELGRGAQGRTSKGLDRQTGKAVAIKELMLRDVEDWKAIELFEREGMALRHLDHPGIPAYVDAFHVEDPETGEERFFLVQEFVDGQDLETLSKEGKRFTEEEARDLARGVLEILMYLQERSPPVIHRDIKPSNIMMRHDGRLALIDFGAVQSVIPNASGGSTIIGTSGYMPVEQLMGRSVPATDLYALGATLAHLLSGRHPADLPMREMRLEFEPFVNLSPGFQRFLARMLDPRLEHRYQTAKEALRALERPAPKPRPRESSGLIDLAAIAAEHRRAQRGGKAAAEDWRSGPAVSSTPSATRNPPKMSKPVSVVPRARRRIGWSLPDLSPGQWEALIAVGVVLAMFLAVGAMIYFSVQGPNYERRCEGGEARACNEWGRQLESNDRARAEDAYARGCELGHAMACSNQGIMALVQDAPERAVAPMRRGCRMNHSTACTNLGWLLRETDPEEGIGYAQRGCELESALGCANYAAYFLMHYHDGAEDPDLELRRARRYAQRGCDGESESGCYRLALANLYLGEVESAMRAAVEGVRLNARHPHTQKAKGLVLLAEGDREAAGEAFRMAYRAERQPGGSERAVLSRPLRETIEERLELLGTVYPERAEVIAAAREEL